MKAYERKLSQLYFNSEVEKQDCIDHYTEILDAARTYEEPRDIRFSHEFTEKTGISLTGDGCVLCQRYYDFNLKEDPCWGCPLHESGHNCMSGENPIWLHMRRTRSKVDFIKFVMGMLDLFESGIVAKD